MNRIKKLRQEKEMNQDNLGTVLGRTQATISGWEKGKFEPNQDDIKEMCKIFRCTSDYLMGHTDKNEISDLIETTPKLLTAQQKKLLDGFDSLAEDEQTVALDFIDLQIKHSKNNVQKDKNA